MKTHHIIAGLLLTACLTAAPAVMAAPKGLPAEAVTVEAKPLAYTIRAVGNLSANESIQLSPEQSGRIEKILFREGQSVTAGDPLFLLDAAIYRAELEQAQARVNLSRIAYDRAQRLLQKKVGSAQDRDSTLAQLHVDEAQQALAHTRLEKMTVRAPFDGITGLRTVSPGDYVNAGDPLVELTDMSVLKATLRVPEIYLSALRPGSALELLVDAFPGRIFHGEVTAIAPSANTRAHNIEVRARIPNPEGELRPGLFAEFSLTVQQDQAALLVPEQAIIPQDGGFFVMRVAQSGSVELTPVKMGQRRPGIVQITEGLSNGDVVITAGQIKLRPGMPVTPIFTDGSGKRAAQGE